MTTTRELLEQALEYVIAYHMRANSIAGIPAAIDLEDEIREHLARTKEPEPVAYLDKNYGFMRCGNRADQLPIGTMLFTKDQL